MPANLKIGDQVLWGNHTDPDSKNMYEIIGDKDTPYDGRNASPFHQPISVNKGFDFLLRNITPDGRFHPFQHVLESDLKPLKKSN